MMTRQGYPMSNEKVSLKTEEHVSKREALWVCSCKAEGLEFRERSEGVYPYLWRYSRIALQKIE